jgi:HPt (histidine-containing phosphotransfer) domain-containing protein
MHSDTPARGTRSSGGTPAGGAIDAATIQGLRELGGEDEPGLLGELIDMFLEDAPERMRDITEGLAKNDIGRVERGAHTLKSSSANVGALVLSDLCRRIVESSRTNHPERLPELCRDSERSLREASDALRSLKS